MVARSRGARQPRSHLAGRRAERPLPQRARWALSPSPALRGVADRTDTGAVGGRT